MQIEGSALEIICFAVVHIVKYLNSNLDSTVGTIFVSVGLIIILGIFGLAYKAGKSLVTWLKSNSVDKGSARDALIR